jgi:predicted  nucleic acid-binding Zn-ribbon protein
MINYIPILINMQKIDDQISELNILKEQKPKQLEKLISDVNEKDLKLKNKEKQIETNNIKQKEMENLILQNKEQIKKYGNQLESIKNNKEYKALNSEISHLDEKNKSIETDILNIMEEADILKNDLKIVKEEKKNVDANLKKNKDILNAEIVKVDNDISVLKENRSKLAKDLPESIVKKYVALIKNKNKKAVAYIDKNACSGCGYHIRPQVIIELNSCEKIIYCDNCGRMLVKTLEI